MAGSTAEDLVAQTLANIDGYRAIAQGVRDLFSRFYNWDVTCSGLEHVEAAAALGSIMFVPRHTSHLDYMIIPTVLDEHFRGDERITPSFIMAGDNLFKGDFEELLPTIGAYPVPRDPNNQIGRGRAVIMASQLLCMGRPNFIFLEGGRSYDGRPRSPEHGVIQTAARALKAGRRDVVFVPCSAAFTYIAEDEGYQTLEATKGVGHDTFRAASYYMTDIMQIVKPALVQAPANVHVQFGPSISLRARRDSFEETDEQLAKELLDRAIAQYRPTATAILAEAVRREPRPIPKGDIVERVHSVVRDLRLEARQAGHDLPDPLTAYCSAMQVFNSPELSAGECRKRLEDLLGFTGTPGQVLMAKLGCPNDKFLDIANFFLKHNSIRDILSVPGNNVTINEPGVVDYYANTIAHYL